MKYSPAVLLVGPRQAGKSTLASSPQIHKQPVSVESLDTATTRSAAIENPDGFIDDIELPVVIDEIQKAPALLDSIKARIDRERVPGSFILTGSANVMLLPKVAESLTGRVEVLTLWPLSQGEFDGTRERFIERAFAKRARPVAPPLERGDLTQRMMRGGFPETLTRPAGALRTWFENYISTSLSRDLRDLADVERIEKIPLLLRSLAARTRAPVNKSSISSEIGLPLDTLSRYLILLERGFLVHRIPAFSRNIGKQLAKTPKFLSIDSGLMTTLLQQTRPRLESDSSAYGLVLENFVGMELSKQISFGRPGVSLNHFRAGKGIEVDFIVVGDDGRVVAVEVKSAGTVTASDFRGMSLLRNRLGSNFVRGIVLYTGNEVASFGDRLAAWPVSSLWTEEWK